MRTICCILLLLSVIAVIGNTQGNSSSWIYFVLGSLGFVWGYLLGKDKP